MTTTAEPVEVVTAARPVAHRSSYLYPPRLLSAAEAAARYLGAQDSPNTARMFAVHWKRWGAFCAEASIPVLPVQPLDLITHLSHLTAEGAAPNSVRAALNAISTIDQRARATPDEPSPIPVRSDFIVKKWAKGWNRENPLRPRSQAPCITPAQLDLVLQQAQERRGTMPVSLHVATYARDRAMLLMGITGALRISEVVGLSFDDVTPVEGKGLSVLVRTSKTDQFGEGRTVGIVPQTKTLRCPVDAWNLWIGVRGTWAGPAFVAVRRNGEMSEERLSNDNGRSIIRRRAKAAGLELITSHSMRATFATLGREKGKTDARMMKHGGWASPKVFESYARQGDLFRDNPSEGLLDD